VTSQRTTAPARPRDIARPPGTTGAPGRVSLGPHGDFLAWAGGTLLVVGVFLLFKMFSLNYYAGDEHIYIYQGWLIMKGLVPYADFSAAHPPLQLLLVAIILKLFGYHFLLARLLPVGWTLAGGLILALGVRRELGTVASLAATASYLLAYDVLRASSHFTGIEMTVALLLATFFSYRRGRIRTCAILGVLAVLTRLYALPGLFLTLGYALLMERRRGLRILAWTFGLGLASAVAIAAWAGPGPLVREIFRYHALKMPMSSRSLASTRTLVLAHNVPLALLFTLAVSLLVWRLRGIGTERRKRGTSSWLSRIRPALQESGIELVAQAAGVALVYLVILTLMTRIWIYYFILAFPFAAVAAGWLVAEWLRLVREAVRLRGRPARVGFHRKATLSALSLLVLFLVGSSLRPFLLADLEETGEDKGGPASEHILSYDWKPGRLPAGVNRLVRRLLWRDSRILGKDYPDYTYLLWHESRTLEVVEEVVHGIAARVRPEGTIFGDASTVPLFALLSQRRIAANEIDTNLQRYRSGFTDPAALIRKIDLPSTEMIITWDDHGVAVLPELKQLLESKYTQVGAPRDVRGVCRLFVRRNGIDMVR
jgi:hypothetical protein